MVSFENRILMECTFLETPPDLKARSKYDKYNSAQFEEEKKVDRSSHNQVVYLDLQESKYTEIPLEKPMRAKYVHLSK
jgi:hypothetical protein